MTDSVSIKFRIVPAFKIEIVSDSTGKKWDGQYTYGRTAREGLLRWRAALTGPTGPYTDTNLTFKAEDATLVDAISWKTPITKEE